MYVLSRNNSIVTRGFKTSWIVISRIALYDYRLISHFFCFFKAKLYQFFRNMLSLQFGFYRYGCKQQ